MNNATGSENEQKTKNASRTIPTFLTLYIFGFLYQLLLSYDALRLKNTIQVIGLCLFNLALLLYAAVQMEQIKDAVNRLLPHFIDSNVWTEEKPYLIAIPCVIAIGTVFMSFVAWKLYDEFAWTIYKHISADLRMKRRYLTFQIYIALLKFDFFLFIGFTIQFVVIVVNRSDVEFWLTIAAIPVTILILIMAGIFTRRESRIGMASIIVSLAQLSLTELADSPNVSCSTLSPWRTSYSNWSECTSQGTRSHSSQYGNLLPLLPSSPSFLSSPPSQTQ